MRRGLSTDVVVRAGADLADEAGFESVTVSALARRVGVRTPSLYAHVAGSTDLLARISALALDELADATTAALAGLTGRAAVSALLETHGGYARSHPGRYAAMRFRLPTDPEESGAGVALAIAAGRRHAEILREVLRDYDLAGDAEVHAIRLLGSVVQGFTSLDVAGGFEHSDPPGAASREFIVDGVDAVLRSA